MKGLILFQDPKHIQWFYAQALFLSHEILIIWVPIAICRIQWNNHQKLSQLQAFWYHVFQTLLILNGRIDATNNHKHMKLHIILIKHLINIMLKAINPITFNQQCTSSAISLPPQLLTNIRFPPPPPPPELSHNGIAFLPSLLRLIQKHWWAHPAHLLLRVPTSSKVVHSPICVMSLLGICRPPHRQQLHRVLRVQSVGPQEVQQHHWSNGGHPKLCLPLV